MSDWARRDEDYENYGYIASYEISEFLFSRRNEGKGPKGEIRDYLSEKIILNKRAIKFRRKRDV